MKRIITYISVLVSLFVPSVHAESIDTTYVNNKFWVSGIMQELPSWLSVQSQEADCVVAISDTGVKPEIGREQAIERGVFTYALQQGIDIRAVHEVYEGSKSSTYDPEVNNISSKVTSIGVIYALNRNYSYEVIQEEESRFGEVILLMRIGQAGVYNNEISFSATIEMMEQLLEDRYDTSYQTYTCTFKTASADFELHKTVLSGLFKDGECITYNSQINGDTLSLPRKETYYQPCAIESATSKHCFMASLEKSYWNGFLGSLVKATMDAVSTSERAVIKQTEETFNGGVSDIVRQVLSDSWSMTPRLIGVLDKNELMVEWNVVN